MTPDLPPPLPPSSISPGIKAASSSFYILGVSTKISLNKNISTFFQPLHWTVNSLHTGTTHVFINFSLYPQLYTVSEHLIKNFNWNQCNQIWTVKRGSIRFSQILHKMYSWASNLGRALREGEKLPVGVRSEASACSRLHRKQQEKHRLTLM